jgi:hypothetical protein
MNLGMAARKCIQTSALRIYLPTTLCFLVICVTNATILHLLAYHGLIYGADPSLSANFDKTVRFFLIPVKSLIFFVCTAVLIVPLGRAFLDIGRKILTQKLLFKTMTSVCICIILTSTVFPISFGRSYARISTDPFNQNVDQLYRRILIPGLANLYHLDGFLYAFLFWAIVLFTALVARVYSLRKDIDLSIMQEVSLLTVGVFVSSFQCPGYPEIAVLLLAIIALIEFENDGVFTSKQLAAFSLALMAHEACAVIVFAPMILFLFGRKSWIPTGIVTLIYGVSVLTNFSFNISVPLGVQTTVSDIPATVYFWRSPSTVLIAALFSFKVLWVIIVVALFYMLRNNRRVAGFVLFGVALALASTYIAVDYTRLVGFATIPLIVCFVEARRKIPLRLLNAIMAVNILTPSFYVGGNCGLLPFRGLYYGVYSLFLKLPPPSF